MSNKKECVRCKGEIDTDVERYVSIKDCEGKKVISKLWYHKKCFHEVMTGKGAMNNMIQRASKIFNFAEDKLDIPKEEYEVKA